MLFIGTILHVGSLQGHPQYCRYRRLCIPLWLVPYKYCIARPVQRLRNPLYLRQISDPNLVRYMVGPRWCRQQTDIDIHFNYNTHLHGCIRLLLLSCNRTYIASCQKNTSIDLCPEGPFSHCLAYRSTKLQLLLEASGKSAITRILCLGLLHCPATISRLPPSSELLHLSLEHGVPK